MWKFKFNKNTSKHKASQYSFKLITVDNQFFFIFVRHCIYSAKCTKSKKLKF